MPVRGSTTSPATTATARARATTFICRLGEISPHRIDAVWRATWTNMPRTARTAALEEAVAAGGVWRILPPYPYGHVQIADHRPYDALPAIVAVAACCAVLRIAVGAAGRRAGRRAATALHGEGWHAVDGIGTDWRRFGHTCWYTTYHVAYTAFFVYRIGAEATSWLADTGQWWAFEQPALSAPLAAYCVAQAGANLESALFMGLALYRGRTDDASPAMLTHHVSTLVVMAASARAGFVRVGAAVVFLHDGTDIFIDALRIFQALDCRIGMYTAAPLTLLSWVFFRLYIFPRFVIASALADTGHLREHFRFMPSVVMGAAYAMYVVPLCVLFLLHCYWFVLLSRKISRVVLGGAGGKGAGNETTGAKRKAHRD